jgi:K+-transporting ATPase ATPase A chain
MPADQRMFDLLQMVLFVALVIAVTIPLGAYMARVFEGRLGRFGVLERGLYRLAGVDEQREQSWTQYAGALLVFNALGIVLLMALLMLQAMLPLNPQNLPGLSWHLALNTAVSFVTNTNWQSYGGETTMSYFSQMVGLTLQNFVSASTGIAAALALTRGIARRQSRTLGNFWVDLTRGTLYVFLPLCLLMALVLVWQGVPQNFDAYVTAHTVEGAQQTLGQGPVASQVAIKQLGTNGGGFFNANAAHPYENPTPLSNLIEMLAIFAIPAGLVFMYGRMVGDVRQGWAIYAAMMALFVVGLGLAYAAEIQANPLLPPGIDASAGNLEGKETRFGIANSVLWSVVTTAASCGAVNAMHDSFLPLGGLIPLINMMLGEIVFGGVGAGLYGMLNYVLIAVFIAGLMVGRTPEYVGKKIEAREVRLLVLALLAMPIGVLLLAAPAAVLPASLAGVQDAGRRCGLRPSSASTPRKCWARSASAR